MELYKRHFKESTAGNATISGIKSAVDNFISKHLYDNDEMMELEYSLTALADPDTFQDMSTLFSDDGATIGEVPVNSATQLRDAQRLADKALKSFAEFHASLEDLQLALQKATAIDPGI